MFRRILSVKPDQNLNHWFLLTFLVGSGFLFRLRAYWFNRSIWLDEAALANNVIQNSTIDLITKPLAYGQSAPIGFLVAEKLLVTWISESEKVLRLLPLGAGMLLLVMALWLGSMVFTQPLPRLVFVGLVAYSPILIFYSIEFKQYIWDACLALLFLALGVYLLREQTTQADQETGNKLHALMIVLGVAGFIGIWFSQPVVFFLFGVGMSLFLQAVRQKRKISIILLSVIGMSWLSSFGFSMWLMLKNVTNKQDLFGYWATGFAPGFLNGFASIKWYLETELAAVYMAFQEQGVSGPNYHAEWYHLPNILLGLSCLLGGLWILVRHKQLGLMLILSGAAIWMASLLRYYPLRGRLFLFAVPIVFLFAAGMIDFLEQKNIKYLNWLFALGFVGIVFFPSVQYFIQPFSFSEIRTVLPYLMDESESGKDLVAVSQWSMLAYEYYSPRFGLDNLGLHAVINIDFDAQEFLRSVCTYPDHGRMWLVFSHRMPQAESFLATIRNLTPQLDQFESKGAGVYLFDFSEPDVCTEP